MSDQPKSNSLFGSLYPAIASCLKLTLLCPLDRCQLILQTQSLNVQVQNQKFPAYKNAFDFFKRMFRSESPRLMWRGNTIQLAQKFLPFFPQLPMILFIDPLRVMIDGSGLISFKTFNEFYLYGSALVVYPVEVIRVRIMSDIGPQREFKGFFDCAKQIRQVDGIKGYFRGLIPHIFSISFFRGSYLLGHKFIPRRQSMFEQFIRSQLIIFLAGIVAYPCITIQRQMIMQSARSDVLFEDLFGCIGQMYAKGGLKQFYRGYVIGLLQILVGTGLSIVLI